MMKTTFLMLAAGLGMSAMAQAAPRTIEFQAIVSEQSGAFGPGVGEAISGRVSYDTEAGQIATGAIRYRMTSIELDLGAAAGKAVFNDARYALLEGVTLEGRGGFQLEDVGYEFGHMNIQFAQAERDFHLPDEPSDLQNWVLPGTGRMWDGVGALESLPGNHFTFQVTSVAMVPEASTLVMSVLGVAASPRARPRAGGVRPRRLPPRSEPAVGPGIHPG